MENQEKTPMQSMINWVENGCSLSGDIWDDWKEIMLNSERMAIIEAKTETLINQSKKFLNDN
jgi:hypothetical protein